MVLLPKMCSTLGLQVKSVIKSSECKLVDENETCEWKAITCVDTPRETVRPHFTLNPALKTRAKYMNSVGIPSTQITNRIIITTRN